MAGKKPSASATPSDKGLLDESPAPPATYSYPSRMIAPHPVREIKVKSLSHLHLTDGPKQFTRWLFSLKNHLITLDPVYEELFDGSDDPRLIEHERQLAYLLTSLIKDMDAQYIVAGRIRRHKERPGTEALKALADTFHYDPIDHAQ